MRYLTATTLFVLTFSTISLGQAHDCGSFNETVRSTYNFKPSKLNSAQQNVKAELMDRFWNSVKGEPEKLLPCLRAAVQDPKTDSWFRFDGSSLLVAVDPSRESKMIQVRNY